MLTLNKYYLLQKKKNPGFNWIYIYPMKTENKMSQFKHDFTNSDWVAGSN